MRTLHLYEKDETAVAKAAAILQNGGLVAVPTETVYGLAGNALFDRSVQKIYIAKGRPSDNPIIVHIADFEDIYSLALSLPPEAMLLAKAFWPGPFTMVLPKSDKIPSVTSGGLDTVAVRMPDHDSTRAIIRSAGFPVAAPSANTSSRPSPTTAQHVLDDLDGKIEAVFDGGTCKVGVESTVVTFQNGTVHILRPGAVTAHDIRKIVPNVTLDKSILEPVQNKENPLSPGMKYRHYAPQATVFLVNGSANDFATYVNGQPLENAVAVCFNEDKSDIEIDTIVYGKKGDDESQAASVFAALRYVDEQKYTTAYVHAPRKKGIGLAVYNRLLHAASYKVIDL